MRTRPSIHEHAVKWFIVSFRAQQQARRKERTVVGERPSLLCKANQRSPRLDAAPPRYRLKHPPHDDLADEAEDDDPPSDEEGVAAKGAARRRGQVSSVGGQRSRVGGGAEGKAHSRPL